MIDPGTPGEAYKITRSNIYKPTIKEATKKPTNPKDAIGSKKVALHHVPAHVLLKLSLALLEGAIKYGSYNYRVAGVRSSIYYDAFMRHVMAWWEGQDIDPESGLPHLVKAMACLVVLEDARQNGLLNDDRPPRLANQEWVQELNKMAKQLIERLPPAVEPYTEKDYRQTELFKEVNPSAQDWQQNNVPLFSDGFWKTTAETFYPERKDFVKD